MAKGKIKKKKIKIKSSKSKINLPFEKKTSIEKPIPEDFGVFEFEWEKGKKVAKPAKSDFKTKFFKWEKEQKIAKPKKSDFIFHSLNWKIPWLDSVLGSNKIEEPRKEDFEEKKERKIIVSEEPVVSASTLIGSKKEEDEEIKPVRESFDDEQHFEDTVKDERDIHAGIILLLIGVTYLTFLGMFVGRYLLQMPLADYLFIHAVFLDLTILSIIASALYAIRKNIFYGFAYISIVVIIYVALSFLFAETLLSTITTLLIVLAILPIEGYLVMYVKK
jgi:hypothetical protein